MVLSLRMPVGSPEHDYVANQWYHFGIGAPPMLVYFSWDLDVHWGTGF